MKDKVDKELVLVRAKLTELQRQKSPFKIYIQKEVPMLENIAEVHRVSIGFQLSYSPDTSKGYGYGLPVDAT